MSQALASRTRRPRRALTVLLVVVSSLVGALVTGVPPLSRDADAAPATNGWRLSTLGSADDVSSLALDSFGDAHACWMTGGKLKYATNAGGAWVTRTVDTPGTGFGITYSSAIAVDHADAVHIAYDGTEKLKYATNASGTWVVTTVDDPGFDVGDDIAFALDSQDKAHVGYLDRQNGHLRYATNASGSWTVSDLGAGAYIGMLAVDADDKVHIVHVRWVGVSQMVHTTNASGGWATTVLGSGYAYRGDLRADADRHLHMTYYVPGGPLYYSTNATGSWVAEVVDTGLGDAANSSMVLDSAGKVHITYGDYGNGDLKYATNASGAWVVSVVDAADDKGYWSSLAIDAQDMLCVTYTDRSATKVRFATTKAVLTCKSVASQDGWVRETGKGSGRGGTRNSTSATLLVGDDKSDRQQRTILTFDTSKLPDGAAVVAATLKLKRQGVSGTNPCTTHGALSVDVGTPRFGSSLALQSADFAAAPGIAGAGIVDPVAKAGFFVAQLERAALGQVSRTGRTQLRLAFATASDADGKSDCLIFHSGNATRATLRPVLVVAYRVP